MRGGRFPRASSFHHRLGGKRGRPGAVYVAGMGFKSSLLVYTSGEPADLLRQPPPPDPAQSGALVAATHPGWTGTGEPANGSLDAYIHPAQAGAGYAGSFPGIDI